MKILFLTPQLPYPPQQGTALRNWGLIKELARRHEVSLLSFVAPGQETEPAPPLAEACRGVESVLQPARRMVDRLRDLMMTRLPDMARRLESPLFSRRLTAWLGRESFDVVHVEGIELTPYLDILEASSSPPFVVFDDHNCEYLLQKRVFLTDVTKPQRWHGAAYSFVQWLRLRRYEARVCRRADQVVAVSSPDAAALRALVPELDPLILPNGIDLSVYRPDLAPAEGMGPAALVFTGKMDFRPNVDAMLWFVQEILPLVREQVPQAHLWVVGQRPHPRLDVLREDPGVTLTGWVEEVQPYIAGAVVYVAPLRMGGGTRLKLLEAMALGRAVVSTPLGAEGFPVANGRHLLLAETAEAFARSVVELLQGPRQREDLGGAAVDFVRERYDWRALVPELEAIYPT